MEETLGKRIIAHRKRLSMTQDKLADQLGITAQAVSKWENDQSCPDITMLPKLAEIFGISIDELLGHAPKGQVFEAQIVEEDDTSEKDGVHIQKGDWELSLGNSRRSSIGIALWVLLMGGLLLAGNICRLDIDFWDILWSSGLLIFGLFGLLPRFSFFRFGCLLGGAYFLLSEFEMHPFAMGKEFLLPAFLLFFGLSLLVNAVKKPGDRHLSFNHNGKNPKRSHCEVTGDHFDCSLSFGEKHYMIDTSRLHRGEINVSFGELIVDLSGCEEIAPGCAIDASCSFGELTIRVPSRYRVEADVSTSFGNFEVKGVPDAEPEAVIKLDASSSLGEICLQYI